MTSLETDSHWLLAIALAIFFIAGFVFFKGPKKVANRSFAIFALGGGIWVGGIALLSVTQNFLFDKVVDYGGLLFFLGFFLLAQSFPSRVSIRCRPSFLYAPIALMAIGIIPWNYVNQGMIVRSDGSIIAIPGPLILLFMGIISVYVIAGIAIFVQQYRKTIGREKQQLLYLLFGTGSFMVLSVICDAVLPAFEIQSLVLVGPISALGFIALIAYAIVRHRLLDIRVVIQRGIIFSAAFVFVIAVYLGALSVLGLLLDKGTEAAHFATGIVTTLIGIGGVPGIERFFRKKTDNIFFKGKYDYAESLKKLSEILYTATDLDSIVSRAEVALTHILRAESVKINLVKKTDTSDSSSARDAKKTVLSIPIILEGANIGSIDAQAKKSGDIYSHEDRKLLETFAYEAATSLSRAMLYAEVTKHAEVLEKKIAERTEDLRRVHENERQMIMDISHGLQTPLAVFRLKLEQLRRQMPEDSSIDGLEKSLQRLSSFIYDLLRLAELEKRDEFPMKEIDLSELSRDITEEIGVIAEDQGIKLVSATKDDIFVMGDEKRIREAVINIASNSIKYMEEDGRREIRFSLDTDGSWAVLSIKDTGIGIKKDDLGRIFDRFYRGEAAPEHVRGNGLGLTITKRIVEMLGGSIQAESEIGKGTTMTIRLPLIRHQEALRGDFTQEVRSL